MRSVIATRMSSGASFNTLTRLISSRTSRRRGRLRRFFMSPIPIRSVEKIEEAVIEHALRHIGDFAAGDFDAPASSAIAALRAALDLAAAGVGIRARPALAVGDGLRHEIFRAPMHEADHLREILVIEREAR